MARPERNNVDYFPFYCEDGNKMFYIEETYGNDGFSTFIKLLRELAKTNYHFLDLSKPTTIMFLSAKCKITKETLICIINDLVELGKFDKVLWTENKVIWCQDFVDSIQDAYMRRNNNCITYDGLLQHLISLGIRKQGNCTKKDNNNTQSKVDYNKEDKIKENIHTSFDHLKITVQEFNKLLELGYSESKIISTFEAIQNYKKNTGYKSLYLTSKKWLEKDAKENKQVSQNKLPKRIIS